MDSNANVLRIDNDLMSLFLKKENEISMDSVNPFDGYLEADDAKFCLS